MQRRPGRWRRLFALCVACASLPVSAAITLRFEAVSAPQLTLDDVSVRASSLSSGPARIEAARANFGGRMLQDVRLDCADFAVTPQVRCRGGVLRARRMGPWQVEFAVTGAQRELNATLRIDRDVRVDLAGRLAGPQPHIKIQSSGLDLGRLLGDEVVLKPYVPAGRVNITAELTQIGAARTQHFHIMVALSGGAFGSADGLRAADALRGTVNLAVRREGKDWAGQLQIAWQGGELLWDSLYLAGGGSALSSDFVLSDKSVALSNVMLDLADVGRLTGSAGFGREPLALRAAEVHGRAFDLQALNERFIVPLLAARGWPTFAMTGRADLSALIDQLGMRSVAVRLHDAEVADAAGRFSLSGINADLPWLRDAATDMTLAAKQGRFGRVPLGRFEVHAEVAPDHVAVQPVRIPLLDAGLRLNMLRFDRVDGRWNGDLSTDLEPLSMPALTAALGWPRMAGSLGASVPRVRWQDGVLSLDGQMLIQVFDGYVAANGLQIIEPFAATPRVLADLQIRYIDMEAMTETFQFGRITGRIDGDVDGLELSRWVPVSFDARIRSSPGDYPRAISQRAVESITALGGAGAVAAIQRSFLGVFERFGYKRMGLSCRLRNGVCEMDGLEAKGDGFMLVEGGGLPALSVVGYNRRVDWSVLLERLARVTGTKPVVQ